MASSFRVRPEREIDILAYSALLLAEDAGLLAIIIGRAGQEVRVRIALGDSNRQAVIQRGPYHAASRAVAPGSPSPA